MLVMLHELEPVDAYFAAPYNFAIVVVTIDEPDFGFTVFGGVRGLISLLTSVNESAGHARMRLEANMSALYPPVFVVPVESVAYIDENRAGVAVGNDALKDRAIVAQVSCTVPVAVVVAGLYVKAT